ncbi:DMT family transporter [Humibacter sp.]|uniref:DMT family transporter n=1 Tax=Humibacter sp. TaxID=1940291 RepID=UPI003F7FB54E
MVLAILFALCGAASNGFGTVLQRRAARAAPDRERFRPALMLDLLRRRTWLLGIGTAIGGFVFQAAALSVGELSLVQPLFAAELPLTLVIMRLFFHSRPGRRAWIGGLGMAIGLATLLIALAPHAGNQHVPPVAWIVALSVIAALILGLVLAGRSPGATGAAVLGAAAGIGFGTTAAVMKVVMGQLRVSIVGMLASWQVYTMIAAGILSFFLLQNALQSGSLVATQPAVTLSDPIVSVVLGVVLFHDQVRFGFWLIPEIIGLALILAGSIELSRSPVLTSRTST